MKSKQILIVEDERHIRNLLAFELRETLGCPVFEAQGGREAIEILKKNSVDLVISDVMMPDGDGVQLVEWIRSSASPDMGVILMTGYSKIHVASLTTMRAVAIFEKPFHPDDLVGAIRRALEPTG